MKELNVELRRGEEFSTPKYVKTVPNENCLIVKTGSAVLRFDPVEEAGLLDLLLERSNERRTATLANAVAETPKKKTRKKG